MERDELLARITIDPNVCFGKPVIRGTRIWVALIVNYLASGETVASLLREYPQLEEVDVRPCLAYAAQMVDFSDMDVA